jgi:hypothetical protein
MQKVTCAKAARPFRIFMHKVIDKILARKTVRNNIDRVLYFVARFFKMYAAFFAPGVSAAELYVHSRRRNNVRKKEKRIIGM